MRDAARAAAAAGSGFDSQAFSRLTDADLRPVVLRDFQVGLTAAALQGRPLVALPGVDLESQCNSCTVVLWTECCISGSDDVFTALHICGVTRPASSVGRMKQDSLLHAKTSMFT